MHRFSSFDDSPVNYTAWKIGFLDIVKELRAKPIEELDLLTKWLGPESRKYALSIRAANVCYPERGLKMIWDRLEDRFGKPEMVEASLKKKLQYLPRITDSEPKRLYDLLDILHEIDSNMHDERYAKLLSYFDSSSGVIPIVGKLTRQIQEKWASRATSYKRTHHVSFPPFTYFINFIQEMCELKNDPGLSFSNSVAASKDHQKVLVRKSDVGAGSSPIVIKRRCPIHKADHALEDCKTFLAMSLDKKRECIMTHGLCLRCVKGKHMANKCKSLVKCNKCGSKHHMTCMHFDRDTVHSQQGETTPKEGTSEDQPSMITRCSQLCMSVAGGRSCGKIVLVRVYPQGRLDLAIRTYAIIDDQANKTLAVPSFFDSFNIHGDTSLYEMKTCNGSAWQSGRTAEGFVIEPITGETQLYLPQITECTTIPNNRSEIPTPDVASAYRHLEDIAPYLPDLDDSADILLLIGRDMILAHHVLDQREGDSKQPFAQKLHLGWTIIGDVCLQGSHVPRTIDVRKTNLLTNGRSSHFEPCESQIHLSEKNDVFASTPMDEKPGLSTEDRIFLDIMSKELTMSSDGKWTAPLPFRPGRPTLPNNRAQALRRAMILDKSFEKNRTKRDHALDFMQNILERGHAELAPPLKPNEECWFLPIFGIYHPMKPNKIRMVFDSSARYQDVSLNNVLLSGPDLTNSLIGVLMRFRMEKVAVTADIEHMFHCFAVAEKHRNYLRFFWYQDNDPSKPFIEYRMCVHVFGNTPSPAVATYGLRRAALEAELTFGRDVRELVDRNFYVDDALVSVPTSREAVDLVQRAQQALKKHGQLRLHKIASNDPQVMQNFPANDLAKDLVDLDITKEDLPTQRSLGLIWNLQDDSFGYKINLEEKPYTRRGVLSCVNSLYDPLGFIAPHTIQGKLLLREMTQTPCLDWDSPLPEECISRWTSWRHSLTLLETLRVPRQYLSTGFSVTAETNILVFTDASQAAIAAVAYLYDVNRSGSVDLGFIMGKSKVAPKPASSIPRLELCAAVLGVEVATIVRDQLDISAERFRFFTDSKIVLGYIHNHTKRFLTYVSNRVQKILNFGSSSQWDFVPTDQNPADHGTKPSSDRSVGDLWLHGPQEWLRSEGDGLKTPSFFDLVEPSVDSEIKQEVIVNKNSVSKLCLLGTHRFERFSSWRAVVSAVAFLKRIARRFKGRNRNETVKVEDAVSIRKEAEHFILRQVQLEVFNREMDALERGRPLRKDSHVIKLNPILDDSGILRVGGRLRNIGEQSPILLPGKHHIAKLLVRYYHEQTLHQGRHLTEGAIRSAGLWITGAKRLVSSLIHHCVRCIRARGKPLSQKMADLPEERLISSPPFTYVGVDCFGPWEVTTRRTRGGSADSKRWTVIFTCMCSRAVHLEVLEQMSTPSFINALRRFYAIRGQVKEFYSDRGTNFVGGVRQLGIPAIFVEDPPIQSFLIQQGTTWKFNTPYSSHMGGAWERLIGITRRILDSLLFEVRHSKLTHEVLTTFLAEVSAIINNRPMVPVSSDPDAPSVLTPNTLLTQKTGQVTESPMNLNVRDLYTSQWKIVQLLAERFWTRWRQEYIQSLQLRRKWTKEEPNIQVGDIVLLKDGEQHRNYWPLGRVERVFPSKDGLVRKIELVVVLDGVKRTYVRPITQVVLLLSVE